MRLPRGGGPGPAAAHCVPATRYPQERGYRRVPPPGHWVYYWLARQQDPGQRRQVAALVHDFVNHDIFRADAERLLKTRRPGDLQVTATLGRHAVAEAVGTALLLAVVWGRASWPNGSQAETSPSPCSPTALPPAPGWWRHPDLRPHLRSPPQPRGDAGRRLARRPAVARGSGLSDRSGRGSVRGGRRGAPDVRRAPLLRLRTCAGGGRPALERIRRDLRAARHHLGLLADARLRRALRRRRVHRSAYWFTAGLARPAAGAPAAVRYSNTARILSRRSSTRPRAACCARAATRSQAAATAADSRSLGAHLLRCGLARELEGAPARLGHRNPAVRSTIPPCGLARAEGTPTSPPSRTRSPNCGRARCQGGCAGTTDWSRFLLVGVPACQEEVFICPAGRPSLRAGRPTWKENPPGWLARRRSILRGCARKQGLRVGNAGPAAIPPSPLDLVPRGRARWKGLYRHEE